MAVNLGERSAKTALPVRNPDCPDCMLFCQSPRFLYAYRTYSARTREEGGKAHMSGNYAAAISTSLGWRLK